MLRCVLERIPQPRLEKVRVAPLNVGYGLFSLFPFLLDLVLKRGLDRDY